MPEVRQVQTSVIDEKCPVCGNGYMRPTGIVDMSNPPLYQHKCTACQYTQVYTVRYPHSV